MSIDFNTYTDKSGAGAPYYQDEGVLASGHEKRKEQYVGKTRVVLALLICIFLLLNIGFLAYIHHQIMIKIDKKSNLVLNCDPEIIEGYKKNMEVFNTVYQELKTIKK
jgi:hypothetical protein